MMNNTLTDVYQKSPTTMTIKSMGRPQNKSGQDLPSWEKNYRGQGMRLSPHVFLSKENQQSTGFRYLTPPRSAETGPRGEDAKTLWICLKLWYTLVMTNIAIENDH